MSNIGMMGGAYFVGKADLLDWINTSLRVACTRVEDLCTGALYCQLFDMAHPGTVHMSKVNFLAKHEYEYIKNFKVLQSAFEKTKVEKLIEVEKLTKGKYQDNLEFLQWLKAYCDRNRGDGGPYDPLIRRAKSQGGKEVTTEPPKIDRVPQKAHQHPTPVLERPPAEAKGTSLSNGAAPVKVATKAAEQDSPTKLVTNPKSDGKRNPSTSARRTGARTTPQRPSANSAPPGIGQSSKTGGVVSSFDEKITQLQDQLKSLGDSLGKAELDRDFYYQKLRKIEILCQENEQHNIPFMKKVIDIL
eukprot:TRINITY_DN5349_c0_g1_i1.p1 TRINITY_DN5349_c0_g1~~TRINITY_DN5349_c0_g1_i1.p1  ORF type:complete len:302 (-),score=69.63 TRINITY_DN5349_c0_g1_i1:594-1499(-)